MYETYNFKLRPFIHSFIHPYLCIYVGLYVCLRKRVFFLNVNNLFVFINVCIYLLVDRKNTF